MTLYTDPVKALAEADFLASRLMQTVFLVDAGNQIIEVSRSYMDTDTVLEIVRPIYDEVAR